MDTTESTTTLPSDEQVQAWRTELKQRLNDYDTIAAPIQAKIKELEAKLAAKTAPLIPQIRTLEALIQHSEPYSYVTGNRRKGIEEREITITRERHAELTARWGPYISKRFGVSFHEYIASLDGVGVFLKLSELKDWYCQPHWWPTLFGKVPEDEGREALEWFIHELRFKHRALDRHPPVRPYLY
jgi:hypothetical protein